MRLTASSLCLSQGEHPIRAASPHRSSPMNAHVKPTDVAQPRHDWTLEEVEALFELPFMELVFRAAEVHRAWFDPSELQISQLLSVKTGGCAENCGYCAQSQHFQTGLKASKLMEADAVIAQAAEA